MNNISSSTFDNLPLQYSQTPAFTLWAASGLLNCLASLWIIIILIGWKPIKGETLLFTIQLTVIEGLASVANVAIGFYHIKKASYSEPETDTKFNCWLIVGVDLFFVVMLSFLCLAISFDRFFATVFPIKYQHRPRYYFYFINSLVWVLSVLMYGISFLMAPKVSYIPVCQVSQSIDVSFYNVYKYLTFFLSLISVFLYFMTLLILKYQVYIVSKQGGSIVEIKKRMHSKVGKVLAANAIAHLFTFTVADFGTGIVTLFTSKGPTFGPYFASLYFIGALSCFPIYVIFQKQFRVGSFELISKILGLKGCAFSNNTIVPTTTIVPVVKEKINVPSAQ